MTRFHCSDVHMGLDPRMKCNKSCQWNVNNCADLMSGTDTGSWRHSNQIASDWLFIKENSKMDEDRKVECTTQLIPFKAITTNSPGGCYFEWQRSRSTERALKKKNGNLQFWTLLWLLPPHDGYVPIRLEWGPLIKEMAFIMNMHMRDVEDEEHVGITVEPC